MTIDKLAYAIQLAKAGKKDEALPLLKEIVRTDPDNETAWLWLYACVETNTQKIYCLQQALRINPYNQGAQRALEKLTLRNSAQPQSTAKPVIQKTTSGKQKPSGEADSGDFPPMKRKKNTSLIVVLILLSLCVICCVGGWIYIKTLPPSTRTPKSVVFETSTPAPTRTARPTETPEPTWPPDLAITYDNVCLVPDGTEVTITGHLFFMVFTGLSSGEYEVALVKEPEEMGFDNINNPRQDYVSLFIQQGNSPNQMKELSDNRSISDFKIVTNNGKIVGHNASVEISGKMWIHFSASDRCGIRVTKIVAK